jgi:serine/threonine-protein kinase
MGSARPPDAGVSPGDVLAGKYRVDRVLAAGGMGVVVAAHHLQLDQPVAIKFLLPGAVDKPDVLTRFEREARAAVRIKSEHVARVIDVGRLDSGAPYMVMEYLEGGDLRTWLRERGPMTAGQAAEFVLQACEAIAEAHGLGIVHRDLKPANLFCIRRADGVLSVKVLDFGISKVAPQSGATGAEHDVTSTGAVVGSPQYMSPEQLRSAKDVDVRTDIWSLGVILYELVSGAPPFRGDSVTELAMAISMDPAMPLRDVAPSCPAGLDEVVSRCLVKDRERRTQNVGQLAIALRDYAPKRAAASVDRILRTMQESGSSAPALPPPGTYGAAFDDTVSADGAVATRSAWQTESDAKRRNTRRGLAAAGIATAALVLVGAVIVARGRSPDAAGLSTPSALGGTENPGAAPPASAPGTESTVSSDPASAPVATPASASASQAPGSAAREPGAVPAKPRPATGPRPQATGGPTPPVAPAAKPAPTCHIVTEYDSEGQPHFKNVCN